MALRVSSNAKKLGLGGKLLGTLFFGVFLAMGLGFEVMLVKQTARNLATYGWTQSEATIVASEVQPPRTSDADPAFHVRYTYLAAGELREGRHYSRDTDAHETRDAYQLTERFPTGKQVPCWYNPSDAAESVLHRNSPFAALVVLFPLIFVAVGAGGIWAIWFYRGKNTSESAPISSKPTAGRTGRVAIALFFSVFLLVGLGVGYGFFIRPVFATLAARNWPAVPCEIVSSRVRTHSDSDGNTYSVDIVYRYTVDGRTHTANRYQFSTVSSSGYKAKAEVVRRHPAGSRQTCYVDPADPASAVLNRDFTSTLWFGLIPLIFALVGGGGLYSTLRGKMPGTTSFASAPVSVRAVTSTARRDSAGWVPDEAGFDADAPRTLQPATSPKAKLIGLLVVSVFWNGIVSVFLFNQTWSGAGLFMALFLLPFVAIGLGLIGGVFYQGMALFNPRPRLTVSRGVFRPGDTIELTWDFTGRTDRLQHLTLRLEGREEATYRRGTDTVTDKETFARIPILDTADPVAMRAGTTRLAIPPGAMHSFRSANNKIVWSLHLHGKIPRWPDVKEEFPCEIAPRRPAP